LRCIVLFEKYVTGRKKRFQIDININIYIGSLTETIWSYYWMNWKRQMTKTNF